MPNPPAPSAAAGAGRAPRRRTVGSRFGMDCNRACNLEDFADPDLRRTMRRVLPHEVLRFGDGYPHGVEYRKHWEVAMAVASLEAAGVVRPTPRCSAWAPATSRRSST